MRATLVVLVVVCVLGLQAGAVSLNVHRANATAHNETAASLIPSDDATTTTPTPATDGEGEGEQVAASDEVAPPPANHTRRANDTAPVYPQPIPAHHGRNIHADFSLCPNECLGRGLDCVPQANAMGRCVCLPGFSDYDCGVWVGCSSFGFCNGHGQCKCSSLGCACQCGAGWTGADCTTPSRSLCLNHCSGRGRCRDEDHTCECDAGYTGEDCSKVVLPSVCTNGCSAQGSCLMDEGECRCSAVADGADCSKALDACGGCRHGHCSSVGTRAVCLCEAGFTGTHCDVFVPASDPCATHNFCGGHGVCVDGACSCQDGFDGPDCSVVAMGESNGCTGFCSGHGLCNAANNTCVCDPGFSGPDCSVSLCPTVDGAVCRDHGVCGERSPGSGFECLCDPCFSGSDCGESALDHCPSLCNDHGQCECKRVNQGNRTFAGVCKCDQGWEGDECQFNSNDPDCCPLDCSGNGNCKNCRCECLDDWTGADCATRASTVVPSTDEDAMDELLQTGEASALPVDAAAVEASLPVVRSMRGLWD